MEQFIEQKFPGNINPVDFGVEIVAFAFHSSKATSAETGC